MKFPPYKILLVILDFLFLRVAFSAAMQLKGVSHVQGEMWKYYVSSPEFISFFFFSFFILLIFQSRNLYKQNIILSHVKQAVIIFICMSYAVIALSAVAFFFRSPWIIDSRLAVAYFAGISTASIIIYRVFIFTPLYIRYNKKTEGRKKVIIAGSGIPAKSFAVEMGIGNIYGFQLVGFVTDELPKGATVYESYAVLGKIDEVSDIVQQYDVKEIIIAESGVSYEELMHIIDQCRKAPAHINVASPLFEVVHKKFNVDSYFDLPIAPLRGVNEEDYIWVVKRAIDVVGATAGIIILSLPLAVIALLIKLSSPGPIFYSQIRVGKHGRQFNFYKFRSMRQGSDQDQDRIKRMQNFIKGTLENTNGSSKVINEKLVTPIGKFIRKTSLDELPQLFNVLKGDMSLVGPRPCLPYEYEAYDEWHKRRLSVLPGCTGLWQVSSRAEGGFDEMVVLDLYYIGNISPALDLQLILKTIPVMIFGRGGK